MSTFGGKLEEIPGISIDRFDGANVNSTVFFLSHCHYDHMNGLNSEHFQKKVRKENNPLFVSAISGAILRRLYPELSTQIKELFLENVTSVSVYQKNISVTCIPAGHCPGSVMFLFETSDARILYTGDYRINPRDIKKFKCFYDSFGNIKPIDKIYLDTTFFLKSYMVLPKREESLSELCQIILKWISLDSRNCIKIDARAKYGYEYIFKEVYERCSMPVHVENDKYSFYSLIPELDKCVTTDGASTQIHNCRWKTNICESADVKRVKVIKVSAYSWENENFKHGVSKISDDGTCCVCYSTHASYEEGIGLLDFLKPKDVYACVERPTDPVTTKIIKKLIKEKLDELWPKSKTDVPKLFETSVSSFNKTSELVMDSCETGDGSPAHEEFKRRRYSILDSPPR